MEKRLIVNADDYGHTPGVSEGIRQAHLSGIVTSTSVMMNRPNAQDAVQAAKRGCQNLGMGVHLVITSGKPLLPADGLPDLVDAEGFFLRSPALAAKNEALALSEVEAEWRAQISAFKAAAGGPPDHLDSHHHISYRTPGLFELLLNLAREENCALRIPMGIKETLFAGVESMPGHKSIQIRFPQRFFGDFYDEKANRERLSTILNIISSDDRHATFELMCHPAIVDDELRRISIYHDRRGDELNLLRSDEIKSLIEELGIRLIRFEDLE